MPRSASRKRRTFPLVAIVLAAALILPAIAFGHVVVFPRSSTVGSREKFFFRVPNEKEVATTKVELHFPDSVRVSSFADVPGWQLQILTDSAKRISGAIWTGSLAPKHFVEFVFLGSNPKTAMKLAWPAYQTYADGERVEWTGDEASKSPASITTIADTAAKSVVKAAEGSDMRWVPWAALGLSIVSLGLALRPKA